MQPHVRAAHALIERALRDVKNPIIAFSGGKDSLVAAHLMTQHGVRAAVCETSLYFQFQRRGVAASAEQLGLNVVWSDRLPLSYLVEHPHFVFMSDSALRSKFFSLRQQRTVAKAADAGAHDACVFGRRTEENSVRADMYEKAGRLQLFPIRTWREAEVWEYLAANNVSRPHIYSTPYGRDQGNGPWNIYMGNGNRVDSWKAIYETEAETALAAARVLPEGRQVLTSMGIRVEG